MESQKIYRFKSYLKYLFEAKHVKGHGVHSPFAFDLISNICEEKNPYYIFSQIESLREKYLKNKSSIYVEDYGMGESGSKKVSAIAKYSLKKKKHAQLLFRLANYAKPLNILELGTSLGITTAYLASSNQNIKCYSFEGCANILSLAKETLDTLHINNVELIEGNIDETLPLFLESLDELGFVYFDANHNREATISYFNQCINKVTSDSVFVFDDIHYSKGMEQAWKQIIKDERVKVSFDLFSLGIIYFKKELQKQDYIYLF